MTPKEKAAELFEKFKPFAHTHFFEDGKFDSVGEIKCTKQLCLIVCDEKIESIVRDKELFSAAITQLKWGDDKKEAIDTWFIQHLHELKHVKEEIELIGTNTNYLECSGCGNVDITVSRTMYDGLCADCTNKALYDIEFATKARKRNEEL